MALSAGKRAPLDCKAFKGVRDLDDPYSVPSNYLLRARNLYMPEPGSGAGASARPGFVLQNADAPLGDLETGRIGQGVQFATIEDGTKINFIVNGGRLFRVAPNLAVYEDVTPVGITIDPGTRVYLTPISDRLAINDDVNPPWVASDLQATPVTATVIVYSDVGAPWRAYGPGRVYGGAIVWVVRFRDDESRTARIAWSEPDDPLTGYFQTGPPALDNEWDVIENNTETIYALWGTTLQLNYFRDNAIGYASGTIGEDFKSTSTRDAIDDAVGTRSPATIQEFGSSIWFADTGGRVRRIRNNALEHSWLQHRRVVTLAPSGFVDVTARSACSAIVPELDLYLVALWSPDPTQGVPQFPTTLYAWHAESGKYVGEWNIRSGCAVHAMGILVGLDGKKVLTVLGSAVTAAAVQELGEGGFVWTLASLQDGIWTDDGDVPDILATSPPMGYDPDLMLTVDEGVAIVQELVTDPTPALIDIVVA